MKLDYDCIRYILISIEESNNTRLLASSLSNDIYDVDTILYHIECLLDVNYIEVSKPHSYFGSTYGDYFIFRITMFGHQFLDSIRDTNIWTKTKATAKEVGVTTLNSILKIAESIITSIISSKLNF